MRLLCFISSAAAVLAVMLAGRLGAQQRAKAVDTSSVAASASTDTKGKHGNALHTAADSSTKPADPQAPVKNAYDFGLPTEDGKNLPLSTYKGKVLLVVNLARMSSYASQVSGLDKLNQTFKNQGLVVIGVPSNDFGNAEPGTPAEITKSYAEAKLSFPVMQVSSLTGVHELPLFDYLAKSKAIRDDGLHWNFTKFLIDRKGNVIVRFPPEVAPDSLQMIATVQEVVNGTWKPKKADKKEDDGGGGDDDDDTP